MTEFIVKNSDGSIGKTPAPEPTETPKAVPTFGDIGQGANRGEDPLDMSRVNDHSYYMAHRAEIEDRLRYEAERDGKTI